MDSKGVSKLYTLLNIGKDSILSNHEQMEKKTGQIFTHDEIEKAFTINHQSNVNMYMLFIQFRFFHYRVATKYDLCKMKNIQTESCAYCNQQETVQHRLYDCEKSVKIWNKTEQWIRRIGFANYRLETKEIIS